MATTGFWPVKNSLKDVIEYARNPDKTTNQKYLDNNLQKALAYVKNDDKTDRKLFVSGINCTAKRAYEHMMATKKRFGKTGGNVAYHGFQSFKTGEVTPEEAHAIGLETARQKPITKTTLVSYNYTSQTIETKKIFEGTVTANGVVVYFDTPYVSISSTSGYDKDCLDVEFTHGYLFMRVTSGNSVTITVNAYPYTVTETTFYQLVNTYPNLTENVREYKDYTLINSSNVSTKLAQLVDYHTCCGTIDAKIVLDGEQVGDIVSIETKYNGTKIGKIKSLDLTIGSNMVAQAVIEECQAEE